MRWRDEATVREGSGRGVCFPGTSMIQRLIDFAVASRLLVVLALLAAVVGGVLLLPRLNLDAFPDVTNVRSIRTTNTD